MQSVLLAKVFAEAQMQATHLAEHLQEEVEAQTLELQQKTTEAMEAKEYAELSSQEALRQKAKAETARLDAEELREAAESHAEELKALDKQKTAFFQNMSHELRTPLTFDSGSARKRDRDRTSKRRHHCRDQECAPTPTAGESASRLSEAGSGQEGLRAGAREHQSIHPCLGRLFASACSSKAIDFFSCHEGW